VALGAIAVALTSCSNEEGSDADGQAGAHSEDQLEAELRVPDDAERAVARVLAEGTRIEALTELERETLRIAHGWEDGDFAELYVLQVEGLVPSDGVKDYGGGGGIHVGVPDPEVTKRARAAQKRNLRLSALAERGESRAVLELLRSRRETAGEEE
jgi:hypothetical protein